MLETDRAQLQLPTQTLTSAVERLSEMKTHIWALGLTMWRSLVILKESLQGGRRVGELRWRSEWEVRV